YEKGEYPEFLEKDPVGDCLMQNKPAFVFLNLPPILPEDEKLEGDPIPELLKAAQKLGEGKPISIVPLTLVYDRRPGKEKKTIIDLLFGERENPGSLRKTILFFRNAKKRAVAQVGDPIDFHQFSPYSPSFSIEERSLSFRQKIHQVFYQEQQAITGP